MMTSFKSDQKLQKDDNDLCQVDPTELIRKLNQIGCSDVTQSNRILVYLGELFYSSCSPGFHGSLKFSEITEESVQNCIN